MTHVANHPVQLSVEYKGKAYGGIYSVSGNLMIVRIPGLDSTSQELDGAAAEPLARTLLGGMLEAADAQGTLQP